MIRTLLKVLLLVGLLLSSGLTEAAGLGELKVISALGQPLRAEIDLVSLREDEKASLDVHIAPSAVFQTVGVQYNPLLSKVKVSVARHPDGSPYIRMESSEIVNDPFLDVIIELSWSTGQLRREYTMLFDPVEYPKMSASVSPPKSQPESALTKPVPLPAPTEPSRPANAVRVKRGDTLSRIAKEVKPQEVTLEQMLVGLFEANPQAFSGRNMNRLESGQILRVPSAADLAQIDPHDAQKMVRVQYVDWNAYRQKLATAAVSRGGKLSRSASGKITAAAESRAPELAVQPKEVLKLSKGAAGAATTKMEDEAAKVKALKNESERILKLEKNIQDMNKLLEMKKKEIAKKAPVKLAKPLAAPKPSSQESFLHEMLHNPVMMGALGGAVIGLGGLALWMVRGRKKAAEIPFEEMGREEPSIRPEKTTPEVPDRPRLKAAGLETTEMGESDSIEEARLYFTYRRYVQAKEILDEILKASPSSFEAYLLLMKVHAVTNEKGPLQEVAQRLKAAAPPEDVWERAMEIGFTADPKNPLYAGAVKEAPEQRPAEIDLSEPHKGSLDFDLDFGSSAGAAAQAPEAATPDTALDFDMSQFFGEETKSGQESSSVDFDFSSLMGEEEKILQQEADLFAAPAEEAKHEVDYDFSSMFGEEAAAHEEGHEIQAGEPAGSKVEAELSAPPSEEAVQEIDYDFSSMFGEEPEPAQVSEPVETFAAMEEAAPKLEEPASQASVDYDFSSMLETIPEEEAAAPPAPEEPVDYDFSSMLESVPETSEAEYDFSAMLEEAPPAANEEVADYEMVHFEPGQAPEPAVELPEPPAATEMAPPAEPIEEEGFDFFSLIDEGAEVAKPESRFEPMPEFREETEIGAEPEVGAAAPIEAPSLEMPDVDLNLGEEPKTDSRQQKDPLWYEVATKLDLAKVYQEMGDHEGAHEILEEVLNEGDADQKAMARSMLGNLTRS